MSSNSRDRRRPAPTNSVRRLIVISERIAEAGVPERDAARRCEAGGARPPSPAPPRALRTKSRGEAAGAPGERRARGRAQRSPLHRLRSRRGGESALGSQHLTIYITPLDAERRPATRRSPRNEVAATASLHPQN